MHAGRSALVVSAQYPVQQVSDGVQGWLSATHTGWSQKHPVAPPHGTSVVPLHV